MGFPDKQIPHGMEDFKMTPTLAFTGPSRNAVSLLILGNKVSWIPKQTVMPRPSQLTSCAAPYSLFEYYLELVSAIDISLAESIFPCNTVKSTTLAYNTFFSALL